jgi:predicted DNA-binding transcriptional regulator AlpA
MNAIDNLREPNRAITLNDDNTTPTALTPDVLFIEDVAKVLRVSRSTIERRRRRGSFPVPELPCLDSRPRWSRLAIERFLASTTNGMVPRRHGGQR